MSTISQFRRLMGRFKGQERVMDSLQAGSSSKFRSRMRRSTLAYLSELTERLRLTPTTYDWFSDVKLVRRVLDILENSSENL